jgi:hypothetical protein
MADLETRKVAQQTITIPERVDYQDRRWTLDSGLLKKGYVVAVTVTVYNDKGGVIKTMGDKVLLKEYALDKSDTEVLGVVTLGFAESPVAAVAEAIKG